MTRAMERPGELRAWYSFNTRAERARMVVDGELLQSVVAVRCWLDAAVRPTGNRSDKLAANDLFAALADAVGRDDVDHRVLRVVGLSQPIISRVVNELFGVQTDTFHIRRRRTSYSGWRGLRLDPEAGLRAIAPIASTGAP